MSPVEQARLGFAEVFGASAVPVGVWAAPGRVNVIGEHTDYNDGFVLPMAIDRACYAAAAPRADRVLRVHAAQIGETVEVSLDALTAPGEGDGSSDGAASGDGAVVSGGASSDGVASSEGPTSGDGAVVSGGASSDGSASSDGAVVSGGASSDGAIVSAGASSDGAIATRPTVTGWAAYPVGVAWVLQQAGLPVSGADIYLTSTVPVGAGLSSSAALECATALALVGVSGFELTKSALARHAQRAENDYVGVPCGPLDQMSSAFGEDGSVLFIDTRTGEVHPQPFDLAAEDAVLLVVDTRVSHELGDSGYRDRRAACERAAEFLGIKALRDVTPAALPEAFAKVAATLGETTARRVRHVVTEDERVEAFIAILAAGLNLPAAGRLMTASHVSLRDDYEVSSPELDVAVDAALSAGAHGARMTGGGFGGSAIALVDRVRLEAVQDAVRAAFAEHGFTEPAFFPAVASAGARQVA